MNRNAAASSVCFALCAGLFAGITASAQVVQLPSITTFSYSGSVMVPDRGTTSLGGVRRSAMGSSQRGLSRGFGSALDANNLSVTATIIDQQEIDRQIRGVNAARRTNITRANRTRTTGGRRGQVDQRVVLDPDADGKALVRYARAKYRSGDYRVAFETYRMAIKELSPQLRTLAEAEFRRVYAAAAAQANQVQ